MKEGKSTRDTGTAFLEIEHKFVVDARFDRERFFESCRDLNPEGEKALEVLDTYYVPAQSTDHIYRHRLDKEIQQLTLKSREKDNEIRTEINLELGVHRSQGDAVSAWMRAVGAGPGQIIEKSIRVFDYADCEIVYYEAAHDGRQVNCVEFEAKHAANEAAGLLILQRYEEKLGFDPLQRAQTNLFDMLIPNH